jgi:hypothetical protein
MTTPQDDELDTGDAANPQQEADRSGGTPPADHVGSPPPPSDPEQAAMLDVVKRLSATAPSTAGEVADAMCFPLPEVRRILEQLSPEWVRLGAEGEDGTPQVSAAARPGDGS